jgi:ubiquinol-cytochrome c reductase cytochrome b subunit
MWPWLEARFTGDYNEHNILDRPRDRPIRSALGAATFTFYAVIGLAGGQDIIAQQLDVSINDVLWGLRVLLFVGPVATAIFVYKLCRDLRAHEEHGGGHEEEHAEPPPPEPQAPPEHETPELVGAGAGATGVARPTAWGRRDVDPGDRGSAGARTHSDPVEPD